MSRAVRLPIANIPESLERSSPAGVWILQVSDRFPRRLEEQVLMVDLARALEVGAQRELAPQHRLRARTQHDPSILTGLRRILVDAGNPRFGDAERPPIRINVFDHERDLFGRPEAGEEPKLIVVALRFTPIPMESGDQRFGFVDREGIDDRTILLLNSRTLQSVRGIVLVRMVTIAELERAPQNADRVVV
jgi:hypothetical protein